MQAGPAPCIPVTSKMLLLLLSASSLAWTASAFFTRPTAAAFVGWDHRTSRNEKGIYRYYHGRGGMQIFSTFEEDMSAQWNYGDDDGGGGGDRFDMGELKRRIDQVANPFHRGIVDGGGEVGGSRSRRPEAPSDVYVILFHPGTENEGVHSVEYPRGSGNNLVLAFESMKECDRFSGQLRELRFFEPYPCQVKLDFLKTYCDSMGVVLQVVPEGMEIRPPTESVETLGHNPNLMQEKNFLDRQFFDESHGRDVAECGILVGEGFGAGWE